MPLDKDVVVWIIAAAVGTILFLSMQLSKKG